MTNEFHYDIEQLVKRYPELKVCKDDIKQAYLLLVDCFEGDHKLLVAGNGGSCADAEHIVGELMKGFKSKRPLTQEDIDALKSVDTQRGEELGGHLQYGLPAIALHNHQGLNTAFANDVENGGNLYYAQQVFALGQRGDVLLAISTSGNAGNLAYAVTVAKAKGLKVIGLTGENGGHLKEVADVTIKAPAKETFVVQEYHLPIYHCLCLMIEEHFYSK